MRFRYFDASGDEIELSSIDALKFRIGTGAVTPDTLLYDAAVGRWAPAAEHQVFRFLVDEDQTLLPEASRAMLEEREAARSEGEQRSSAPSPQDPGGQGRTGRLADLEVPEALLRSARPESAASGADGGSGSGRTGAGGRTRVPTVRRAVWVGGGTVLLLGAGALLNWHVSPGGGAGPVQLAVAAGPEATPPPAAASARAIVATAAGPGPEEMSSDEHGSSPSESSGADLESLATEVTAAAAGDLADAMEGLQKNLGVPDRPPEAWLQGEYLADADRYPAVRDYWRRYGMYVASVRSVEAELFRGFVQSRVLGMRLDTAEAASLSARVLERYEGLSEKRNLLYDDLSGLASQAVALHDTLVAHRDEISYQPFQGRELSRDPVIEAVPDDPVLAEEIWGQMDRIFKLLDRIQGIRPVTTLRLQEALLGELEVPGSKS